MGAGDTLRAWLASFLARLASRRAEQRWKRSEKGLGIKRPLREPSGIRQKYPYAITHDATLNDEYAYPVIGRIIEENRHRRGYSANPRTGGVYDVESPREAKALHEELVTMNGYDPADLIYFVSTTNHVGEWTRELHSAYMNALGEHLTPLIGKWIKITEDEEGYIELIYHDVTYTTQMSKQDVIAQGRELKQDDILYVTPKGGHDFEPVE